MLEFVFVLAEVGRLENRDLLTSGSDQGPHGTQRGGVARGRSSNIDCAALADGGHSLGRGGEGERGNDKRSNEIQEIVHTYTTVHLVLLLNRQSVVSYSC